MAEAKDRNAMSYGELVAWAWSETAPVHKSTANLLIHIIAVPLFVIGHVLFFAGVVAGYVAEAWSLLIPGPVCIVVSIVLQGIGHKLEKTASIPFAGPRDFVRRIYAEQFCNFWRFLFSGRWYDSLRASRG